MPLSVLLGHAAPGERWRESDTLLAVALTLHEQALCPGGCGHYRDEAWDTDDPGYFTAESLTCQACAAREEHRRGQDEPRPGELTYVTRELPPDSPAQEPAIP